MRFDTQNAAAYLVWQLKFSPNVHQIRNDGSDIILLDMTDGQVVEIYIVERPMPLSDIQWIFRTNTEKNIYTLMIFWCDMLLPPADGEYVLDDWMLALVSVYGDKIYGFEIAGRDAWYFPVYFDGSGLRRYIRFGEIVNFTNIQCHEVQSDSPYLAGKWKVAAFDSIFGQDADPNKYRRHDFSRAGAAIGFYYEVLGLSPDADQALVKRTYRELARVHHPDMNANDELASEEMRRINDAYARISKQWDTNDD